MKKILLHILSTAVFITILPNSSSAKIWRLNNNGGTPNPAIVADFTGTLQDAHNNASVVSGDTIHIEQSSVSYGNCTFTKKLVLIGAGYFLANNPQTQINTVNESKVGDLNFDNANSAGSVVTGLVIEGSVRIAVANVVIARNKIPSYNVKVGLASGANPAGPVNGIKILQNYFTAGSYYMIDNSPATGGSFGMEIVGNVFAGPYTPSLDSRVGGLFANNSINTTYLGITLNGFTVKNNIQNGGSQNSLSNCSVSYNIGTAANHFQTPATPNGSNPTNTNNQVKTLTQIGWTGTNDAYYQLPSSSAAIGQGEGGIDCGCTAGSYPYKLSGIPAVPNIYSMTIGSLPAGATTISVTVSAKSNN